MTSASLGIDHAVKILRRTLWHMIAATWFAAFLILAAGCEGPRKPLSADAPDPIWSSVIATHTSGPISRKSTIRIVFARNVASAEQIGKPIDALLTVEPRIEGTAMFESARELIFKPKDDLNPGASYRFELRTAALSDVPKSLASYQFIVQVQRVQFDLRFEGLTSRIDSDDMLLRGELLTADVEVDAQVEKLLVAKYEGHTVRFEWQHGPNRLSHRFTLPNLKRADRDRLLSVEWSGKAIGATAGGKREFTVPARQTFMLTDVRASSDAVESERHIVAYFSDEIDTRQDLRGLLRVGNAAPRLRVEGNTIHIYLNTREGDAPPQSVEEVVIDGALKNSQGKTLGSTATRNVEFAIIAPQVRWVGNGVILPDAGDRSIPLSVPFEAVNVKSVRVTAFKVYEGNLPQFLQVNKLDGNRELGRVGRYLWRKTIRLTTKEASANESGRWIRYSLDLSDLMAKNPDGLVRISLSFGKRDIVNDCGSGAQDSKEDSEPADAETTEQADSGMWDQVQYDYEDGERLDWHERGDPCKAAYYYYGQNIRAARNFVVSNFGLLAKRDQQGELLVAVTDLRTADSLAGVKLIAYNFQNQVLDAATTGANGIAKLNSKATPALLVAEKGGRRGYLRIAPGVALPVSHFDVGGERVAAGIKATMYGERGVWRPGNDIHLTFVLQDGSHSLPPNHPVTMELFNPQQQLVQSIVNDKPVGGFYTFTLRTAENAPTGDWTAKATLGGNTFSKTLKIETVMPNRLKVDLSMVALNAKRALKGAIDAQWLTGAVAANLRADVKLRLTKSVTQFEKYDTFVFDDPARDFNSEPETLFDDDLDEKGHAAIEAKLALEKQAPGKLHAMLTTRVFERGGAFSIARQAAIVSPYDRYVGVRLPKGGGYNDALVADTAHTIDIVTVDENGKPADIDVLDVTIYKIDWRWWWDQSGDALAQYTVNSHAFVVEQGKTKTTQGAGTWTFNVKYPQWGRYLLRACDPNGGHCTGKIFYVDWPYWAGRPQDQNGPGATTLTIAADKTAYQVGETAHLDMPEGATGRALLTLETGSRILDARWIDVRDGSRRIDVPLTSAMAPNVYASIELLQPHANKQNDRPLRMLGIVPLKVSDPKTHLHPEIVAAKEWQPESTVTVQVGERDRRAMNYTLAIVDEGLLGLTNFKTPALHEHFFKREALGIATWDVFDEVVGGYGANLERLLALGGSEGGKQETERDRSRFPPVVRFMGPFTLEAGATAKHEVKLPPYIGAVRVMVVAGGDGAYGTADSTVPVRQPLMLLPTLPRVVGPEEEIAVPISVFVSEASIKNVTVTIEPDAYFEVVGSKTTTLNFKQPAEQLAMLRLKTKPSIGKAHVVFQAQSGAHKARAEIYIDVRSSNPPSVDVVQQTLKPGETWTTLLKPHGLAGTNEVTLEISSVPPLNLASRMGYLIHYPYGCVEQTTSSVFPQLYLPTLFRLDDQNKREVEFNVRAGIERLREFQQFDGGFSYWPGAWVYSYGGVDPRYSWSTSYVGHFLLEADKLGYTVPSQMLSSWIRYQRSIAQQWAPGPRANPLEQAYRLYTLALGNNAEIGAMNRLRERPDLSTTTRWMLAAAYKLAGLTDAAESLVKDGQPPVGEDRYPDDTYGSPLRNTAIVLNASIVLGRRETKSLVDEISKSLSSEGWYSTQSVAFSLLAMSKFVGVDQVGPYTFEQTVGGTTKRISASSPLYRTPLKGFPDAGGTIAVKNTSSRTLFASAVIRGVPRSGSETEASSGLALRVTYSDADGTPVDVTRLPSGTDLIAHVVVTNSEVHEIKNIALTQIFPAGWEIHNDRMDGVIPAGERSQPRSTPWYWHYYQSNERKAEYVDTRDDRNYSFFALNPRESINFIVHLNAAYVGRYYLPGVAVEAMYDASKNARTQGRWVEVTPAKR